MAHRVKVTRAATDVSPKVSFPAYALEALAAAFAILGGGIDEASLTLAAAGLVTALVGYFIKDKVEV